MFLGTRHWLLPLTPGIQPAGARIRFTICTSNLLGCLEQHPVWYGKLSRSSRVDFSSAQLNLYVFRLRIKKNLGCVFIALNTVSELWKLAEHVHSMWNSSVHFLLTPQTTRRYTFPLFTEAVQSFMRCLRYCRIGSEYFLVPSTGSCCVFSSIPVTHSTARLTVNTSNSVKANKPHCS